MLSTRMAIGSAVMAGGRLGVKILDLIAILVVARILTPDDFGLVAIAVAVLTIVNALTDLPLAMALVQKPVLERADCDTAFTLSALRGLLVFLAMVGLSWLIAAAYADQRLVPIIAVLGLVPLSRSFASPMMVTFTRDVRFGPGILIEILSKIVAVAFTIVLAVMTGSYWALVAGLVGAAVATAAASYVIAPYRPNFDLSRFRTLIGFSGWMSLGQAVSALSMQSDRLFIGWLLGKSQLGQYTVGSDLASTATYSLAQPLTSVLFASFARIQDDRARLANGYRRAQQIVVAIILPLGVGLAVVADRLINLLLGPLWDQAAFVIAWLAPVVALQTLIVMVEALALGVGNPKIVLSRNLIAFAIRTPATIGAAVFFGFAGAVISRSVTGLLVIYVNLQVARRMVGLTVAEQVVNCWRSLVSACLMAAAVIGADWLMPPPTTAMDGSVALAGLAGLGCAVYVTSHILLWLGAGRPPGFERDAINVLKRAGGQRVRRVE